MGGLATGFDAGEPLRGGDIDGGDGVAIGPAATAALGEDVDARRSEKDGDETDVGPTERAGDRSGVDRGLFTASQPTEQIPIDPVPGALVCNIGDAPMRWTNDVYTSNVHRVVNRAQRSRYSAASFCDPNDEALLEPIAGCVSADRPAKYPAITYADLLCERFEELSLAP